MTNGWAGTILRIDLSKGAVEKEPTEKYSGEFLGGKGINAKILWDEVGPEVHPLDLENRLIFGAGPAVGTPAVAGCRCSVTSKSPQTGTFGESNFGGFWPPELKFAGYDHIVVHGRSERPMYLWIHDGSVELRSAEYLWGKDTIETQEMIKRELGDNDIQVVCIGPGGENKVVSACLVHGLGDCASRTGMGAVMGSKNLKAIAVRGSGEVTVARPTELAEMSKKIIDANRGRAIPTSGDVGGIDYPTPDFKDYGKLLREYYGKYQLRYLGCFNCPRPCKRLVQVPDIGKVIEKCEITRNWILNLRRCDPNFTPKAALQVHKYGLDMMSTSAQVAWLMQLYEKGIITEEDTDGIPMNWGNEEAMYAMIGKIAKREGCGGMFADGILRAAEKIGRGSDKYIYHTKGLESTYGPIYTLDRAVGAAVSESGDGLKVFSAVQLGATSAPREIAERLIQTNFPPELWETLRDREGYKGRAALLEYSEKLSCFPDMLGLCKFAAGWSSFNWYRFDTMVKFVPMITGKDIDEGALTTYHNRVTNLTRAFNIREGFTRKDDAVAEILFSEPPSSTGKPLDRKKFNEMLEEYYSRRGWDANGVPTRKTLEELGLKYVADDLEERNIVPKGSRF